MEPDLDNLSELIEWLSHNDPNGVYRNSDCDAEGIEHLTLEEARDLYKSQLEG